MDKLTKEQRQTLPIELTSQISTGLRWNKISETVAEIIKEKNNTADIEDIILGLYNKTTKIYKKQNIYQQLQRMIGREIIFKGKKRGTYSNFPVEEL